MTRDRLAARSGKAASVAAMLTLATPAMAGDFSGLIYFFAAAFAVIGAIVLGAVYGARRMIGKAGPVTDAVSAIVLALTFAPSTFVYIYGEWNFFLWPVGFFALLGESWSVLFPGPAISVLVTFALIYLFLRSRRQPEHSAHEGEPE